jgi:hypothetical protein
MGNETKAVAAIKWSCVHCGYEQYTDDTLVVSGEATVRHDHIYCDCCGEDNVVTMEKCDD